MPAMPTRMVSLAPITLPDDLVPAMVMAPAAASVCWRNERRVNRDIVYPFVVATAGTANGRGIRLWVPLAWGVGIRALADRPAPAASRQEGAGLFSDFLVGERGA